MVPLEHVEPERLRRLLDAVLLVGSDLDLAAMLRRIAEAAAALVDARYCAVGVLDPAGTTFTEFITVGVDDEVYDAIGALPKGRGVLGKLINEAKPLRVADLGEHAERAGFPSHHPSMTSFLGVPIKVRQEV